MNTKDKREAYIKLLQIKNDPNSSPTPTVRELMQYQRKKEDEILRDFMISSAWHSFWLQEWVPHEKSLKDEVALIIED